MFPQFSFGPSGPRVAFIPVLLLLLGFLSGSFPAASSLAAGGPPAETRRAAWIYWSDGMEKEALRAAPARPALSERALRRMERFRASAELADPTNRPAPPSFLLYLHGLGIEPRVVSRFLRAVSAEVTAEQWRILEGDPRVSRLVPLRSRMSRPAPSGSSSRPYGGTLDPLLERPDPRLDYRSSGRARGMEADTVPSPASLERQDYGPSWFQCQQLNVPLMHELGLSGRGVLVCLLDGGFLTGHEAFAPLDLLATRDFVGQDSIVSFETHNPNEPYNTPAVNDHGTYTWSTLGGFSPGTLVGPAFGATFAVGKTEIVQEEIRFEEDYYVAGLEWADSLGADVVSTSLGYLDFDSGFSYFPEELDGRHAVTTVAAVWLARRGVVLVTAMGNENSFSNPAPNLITPADAESVVSVGAVDSLGRVATFSSRGPTADGRIKPDVCARGVQTACATARDTDTYGHVNGTSLSTPLMGGLVALLKQAHPEWGPAEVIEALRRAGNHADDPDNNHGWGVPDGLKALGWTGPPVAGISGFDELVVERVSWLDVRDAATEALRDTLANPAEDGDLTLHLRNDGSTALPAFWVSLSGAAAGILSPGDSARVPSLAPGQRFETTEALRLHVDAAQAAPSRARFGLRFRADSGGALHRSADLPISRQLWQVLPYPNPLTAGLSLSLDLELSTPGEVRLTVFDVAGRMVVEAFQGWMDPGQQRLRWTPGPDLATGAYFLRLQAPHLERKGKFLFVR